MSDANLFDRLAAMSGPELRNLALDSGDARITGWLAKSSDPSIRRCVARNTNAGQEAFDELSEDGDYWVLHRLIHNPSLPLAILERMRADPKCRHLRVRMDAALGIRRQEGRDRSPGSSECGKAA